MCALFGNDHKSGFFFFAEMAREQRREEGRGQKQAKVKGDSMRPMRALH